MSKDHKRSKEKKKILKRRSQRAKEKKPENMLKRSKGNKERMGKYIIGSERND